MDNLYLKHHGILGMKWGVRRFQNKDGTYTDAGRKRYGFGERRKEKNLKEREVLSKNYRYLDKSLSKDEADRMARNRQIAKKALLIGGTVAVASIAGYAGYKYWKRNADEIIKAGTTLQRIEMQNTDKLHEKFYAVGGIRDKIKYEGMLGAQRQAQMDQQEMMKRLGLGDGGLGFDIKPHKMEIGVNRDLKIAGNKTAERLFNEMMKKDQDFAKDVKFMQRNNQVFGNKGASLYDQFNQALVNDDGTSRKAADKFIKFLSSKGYSGVKDVNDQKYSGYKAVNPVIFFNTGKDFTIKNNKAMDRQHVNKALAKERAVQAGGQYLNYLALGVPVSLIMSYNDKQTAADREFIESQKKKKNSTSDKKENDEDKTKHN